MIWLWVFYLLFDRKKNNVGRASFMVVTFLCMICEMARIVDPFSRGVWSHETFRTWVTLEVLFILSLLLIAADAAAWLNYFSVESLLLKPQRRWRHGIYGGIILLFVQSFIVVGVSSFQSRYTRGVTIGWLLSALFLAVFGLLTIFQSLREVQWAVTLDIATHCEEVRLEIFFEGENTTDDSMKKSQSEKKSKRIAKYLICLSILFIFDLGFGGKLSAVEMDIVHLFYDIVLKAMLAVMLIQRRPLLDARSYELDIHSRYKPFDQTLYSGCDATRTVFRLNEMVRVKTAELAEKRAINLESENDPKAFSLEVIEAEVKQENQTSHRRTPSNTLSLQNLEVTEKHTQKLELTDSERVKPTKEIEKSDDVSVYNAESTSRQPEEIRSESSNGGSAAPAKSNGIPNRLQKNKPSVEIIRT